MRSLAFVAGLDLWPVREKWSYFNEFTPPLNPEVIDPASDFSTDLADSAAPSAPAAVGRQTSNRSNPQKLELTWIGKQSRPKLEPRILLEDPAKSYLAKTRVTASDIFDNVLIKGDNLLALKALEAEFAGKVKCVYIDPPYNIDAAGVPYDDNVEHSTWLTLIRPRIELLRTLLRDDGVLFISIDTAEFAYLRVLADEIFGRANLVTELVWHYEGVNDNQADFRKTHEYILVYAKDVKSFKANKITDPNVELPDDIENSVVKNSPKNPPSPVLLPVGFPAEIVEGRISAAEIGALKMSGDLEIVDGKLAVAVTATSGWSSKNILERFIATGFASVIDQKGQRTRFVIKRSGNIHYVKDRDQGYLLTVLRNLGTVVQSEGHIAALGIAPFGFSKPEGLIQFVLSIGSSPGDLVLDSFGGSGTTAAVAHKMGRRWIMVELGEHCDTHIAPRLQKVIDGQDPGGVTGAADWKGGGGFRYYDLAPSLLKKDKWGQWVINKHQFNPEQLAEAVCKLEGFRYAPSAHTFWLHGQSTERDFIYVTTATLSADQLYELSREVGPDRSLVVCCSAWVGSIDHLKNLTVKQIPKAVRDKCEFGRDDYSLNVAALQPSAPAPTTVPGAAGPPRAAPRKAKQAPPNAGPDLFAAKEPADEAN